MDSDILIKNANMVSSGEMVQGDLLVRSGRIEQIAPEISATGSTFVLEADGKLLMPGMIDDQVHFREPGMPHKADIHTESQAAVAGGITSFMDMPNTNPQTVSLQALEDKYALAADRSVANFAFYFGATNDNIDAIRALDKNQTCGIKVFMGSSTGNMLVDREEQLEAIFRDAPMLLATHCEDTPMIERNEALYREKYGDDMPISYHPEIRSAEACLLSSSFAVDLARRHDTRLHVLHISTARELELFTTAPLDNKRVTAEVCVHYLLFDDSDYAAKGTAIKCNPAIKRVQDRDALRLALNSGQLDVIGTDHAPHTWEEKQNGYFKAPSGLPLVQHALPMLLELYHDQHLSLETLVERACHAPAKLFDIVERGYLREGYWADLVLIDLHRPLQVERDDLLYKCGWSPLEGERLRSTVDTTIVNGNIVYRDGELTPGPCGQRLQFQR